MSASSVARTNPFREIATPPTTAKSTPARASSTNRLPNWKKFSFGGDILGVLKKEGTQILQPPQRRAVRRPTTHNFVDWPTGWSIFIFHGSKLRLQFQPVNGINTTFHCGKIW
jgi:hypothetical protein